MAWNLLFTFDIKGKEIGNISNFENLQHKLSQCTVDR